MLSRLVRISVCIAAFTILFGLSSSAVVQAQGNHVRQLITQNIDESKLAPLKGNVRPEATPANDRGLVWRDLQLDHMLLQLRRSPEQEAALTALLDDLHNPQSPNYHQWLSAAEFGERFGLAQQDLDTITSWLEARGFQVNFVYPSRVMIDFSGTAGQVLHAFHTEIHDLEVKGAHHIANMGEPHIPAALAPAITGIVSLHDFRPHPMMKPRHQYTFPSGLGDNYYGVIPGDLATIYNFNPVFSSGITGQGQSIVLIEDTDLYAVGDWSTFRSTFGLSGYPGTLSQTHPPSGGTNNCNPPGINGDDGEAILDAEYATAAAPSATIQMAACADTQTTFGGLIAMQNLASSNNPPAIISVSYGECETLNGAAANAAFYSTYQQFVSEGTSVFVAAGDSGAASCDQNQADATHGITVSGLASTPYNVAVGGTDFSDTYSGTNASYWNAGNTPAYASARSYVPEIPWNDSCAGALLAAFEGYTTSGPTSFCNDASGLLASLTGTATTAAGSGGPSGCATGATAVSGSGIVSGSCAGYPKPAWQMIPGNPNDGVRDLPDVSLFAANGLWSHFYVFCYSDVANGGTACTGSPSGWTAAGGTSFASPIMAGVQALINQKTGSLQGNPNPTLYSLAATQFNGGSSASCNSSLGSGVAGSCIFYDVTQGDMAVECTTNNNCFDSADGHGVLSTSNSVLQPAYGTNTGWDFATGIGSINVANLLNAWPASAPTPNFSLSTSPSNVTLVQGGASGGSTITVNPTNGFTGSVTLSASGLPSGVTASFATNPTTSTSSLTLTAAAGAATGTVSVTISGTSGSLTHTTSVSLTVNAAPVPDFSLSASPTSVTIVQGSSGPSTITVSPSNGFSGTVSLSASGLPSGVSAGFSQNPATSSSIVTFTAGSAATTGTVTVTITGTSGSLTHTTSIRLTVNAAPPPPDFSLSASPSSVTIVQGAAGTSKITVTPINGFSGAVTLSVTSTLPAGVTYSFSPNPATSSSTLTLNASGTAATGAVTVIVTGTSVSPSLTHTTSITLTINPAPVPDFSLSTSSNSLRVARGHSVTSTITVNPLNGFTGLVTLSASGLPNGVTASFSTNPTTGSSTLTLKAGTTAGTGSTTVTVKGVSGSLTHTTTITLTVTKH